MKNPKMKSLQDPKSSKELKSKNPARDGWEELFALMADNKDDQLIDDSLPTEYDHDEWLWEEV